MISKQKKKLKRQRKLRKQISKSAEITSIEKAIRNAQYKEKHPAKARRPQLKTISREELWYIRSKNDKLNFEVPMNRKTTIASLKRQLPIVNKKLNNCPDELGERFLTQSELIQSDIATHSSIRAPRKKRAEIVRGDHNDTRWDLLEKSEHYSNRGKPHSMSESLGQTKSQLKEYWKLIKYCKKEGLTENITLKSGINAINKNKQKSINKIKQKKTQRKFYINPVTNRKVWIHSNPNANQIFPPKKRSKAEKRRMEHEKRDIQQNRHKRPIIAKTQRRSRTMLLAA